MSLNVDLHCTSHSSGDHRSRHRRRRKVSTNQPMASEKVERLRRKLEAEENCIDFDELAEQLIDAGVFDDILRKKNLRS